MFGKHEFYGMEVAPGHEQFIESGKNAERGRRVNVVEKAVEENKIVGACGNGLGSGDVGGEEIALITIARELNVAFVDVDAKIFGVGETRSVGARAAAHVEDAADLREVVMFENLGKFLLGERELRELEEEGLLEEIVEGIHGRGKARRLWILCDCCWPGLGTGRNTSGSIGLWSAVTGIAASRVSKEV